MNPSTNRFEPLIESPDTNTMRQLLRQDGSAVPPHWTVLTVGEHVEVKGYTFKVGYINETTLVLEPVKIPIIGAPK